MRSDAVADRTHGMLTNAEADVAGKDQHNDAQTMRDRPSGCVWLKSTSLPLTLVKVEGVRSARDEDELTRDR